MLSTAFLHADPWPGLTVHVFLAAAQAAQDQIEALTIEAEAAWDQVGPLNLLEAPRLLWYLGRHVCSP